MIRLKDTPFTNTASFLSHAIGIAEYYGFAPLDTLPRTTHPNPARRPLPLAKVESVISFARREERTLLTAARKCVARMPVPKHLRAIIAPSRDGVVVVPPVTDDTLLAWRVVGGTPGIAVKVFCPVAVLDQQMAVTSVEASRHAGDEYFA